MTSRPFAARAGSIWHRLALVASDPREGLDRLRNSIETRRDTPSIWSGVEAGTFPSKAQVRADVLARYGYRPTAEPQERLHAALGAPASCGMCAEFDDVWADVCTSLAGSGLSPGSGLDADSAFARALWTIVRHRRPLRIVETGVSRGITSRMLLEALERNRDGQLWSIDLPPLAADWREQTRAAVPESLRSRWTFLRGSSRRHLRPLLERLAGVDVFLHDSSHTESNMRFELSAALPALRANGILVADDIHENGAFGEIVERAGIAPIIAQEEIKAGMFGVIVMGTAPVA